METDRQFTGKYEEGGRVGRWLIERFYRAVIGFADRALAETSNSELPRALEMGCGAGFSTAKLQSALGARMKLEACDIGSSLVEQAVERNPEIPITVQSVYQPPFPDDSFELTFLLEVLEHLERPEAALEQMRRITKSWLILSTPREPIWRALNMARGKYLRDFGNTPGHIQHWSTRSLERQVSTHFEVVAQSTPLPWTVLLLRPR